VNKYNVRARGRSAHQVSPMRCRTIILLAMLALPLASCSDDRPDGRGLRWQWTREQETPITEQAPAAGQWDEPPPADAMTAAPPRRTDGPEELSRPVAQPTEQTGPAMQWPTRDRPPRAAVTPTYTPPTPAEQTPRVPTSTVPAESSSPARSAGLAAQWPTRDMLASAAVTPTYTTPTPAEQTPRVPTSSAPAERSQPARAPTVSPDAQPAASGSRVTTTSRIEQVLAEGVSGRTTSGHSRPPEAPTTPSAVDDVAPRRPVRAVVPAPSRPTEIEHPSQLPVGPPPEATRPTDLAALDSADDSAPDDGVRSLADLTESYHADDVPPPQPGDAALIDGEGPADTAAGRVREGTTTVVAASMVQVNDKFITIDDVLNGLHPRLVAMPPGEEEAFRQAVTEMIDQQLRQLVYESLVLGEAEAALSDAQKEAIEDEVANARREMIAHAGGSARALEQYYRGRHTTLAEALDDHRRRLTGRAFLRSQIEPRIIVTRDMLLDYYRKHTDEFVVAKSVQMQLIAAPFEEFLPDADGLEPTPLEWKRAREHARGEIDAAAEAIRTGEDFSEVAKRHSRGVRASHGGVWLAMPEGSFREKEVERNAFALGEGEICGVIETETGYYIVKALKVSPGQSQSFEKAQEQIEGILREQQYDKLAADYFMKLFGAATIAQSDEFMEMAVDLAVDRYWRRN